jgi:hypothetical protein
MLYGKRVSLSFGSGRIRKALGGFAADALLSPKCETAQAGGVVILGGSSPRKAVYLGGA